MVVIENIGRLRDKLNKLKDKYRAEGTPSVVVGYTANYAVYVHEIQARHAPGKQWKFLEQPARELQPQLGQMLAQSMASGVKPLQSLYLIGLGLQRASQDLVPIDTGNLRGSAFTAKEDDLQAVMAASEGKLIEKMQKQGEQREKQVAKRTAVREAKGVRRAKKADLIKRRIITAKAKTRQAKIKQAAAAAKAKAKVKAAKKRWRKVVIRQQKAREVYRTKKR